MCKVLGQNILLSAEFAHHFPGRLVSLGRHTLRGVSSAQELFTLPPASPPEVIGKSQ
jgi:class 3 adenylate cyclase